MSNWEHTITGVDWSNYKLYEREMIFQKVLNDNNVVCDQAPYVVLWEDPDNLEKPAIVQIPSPVWWAMALHGNILPPVEVYWALAEDEAKPGFKRHTRGYLLHETTPMKPMTEEEAMEYFVMKEIPPKVWRDYKGNRTIMKIVPREQIPTDRTLRNAWTIRQENMEVA